MARFDGHETLRVGNRDSSRRRERVRAKLSENYPAYQYRFVEFFVEHVADVSRAFRGDLQQMMVLAIIGQVRLRAVSAAVAAGIDPGAIDQRRLSISASRISDVTGIPRETVRRKLALLEQKGWIARSPPSGWRLVVVDNMAPARDALSELDSRGIDRVANLFVDIETILDRQG